MATGMAGRAGRARAALAASLGLLLVACKETPPPAPPPVASVAVPYEAPLPPPAPHPARKPTPPVLASLPGPVPGAPPADAFDGLQGLTQDAAAAMLGAPEQRAEAPPAVLWRYAGRGCALDLYFYLDLQSREMRVLHYEVRVTDGSERTRQGCYGELVTAHRADEGGSADRPR